MKRLYFCTLLLCTYYFGLLWFVFKLRTLFLIDVQAPQAMCPFIHVKDYSCDSSEE